jgi:hypothetical protein
MKQLSGEVVKKAFGTGSKSEREAVMLETVEGSFVLRRQGGNPFHDAELEKLVGKRIEATGTLTGYTFLLSRYTVLD